MFKFVRFFIVLIGFSHTSINAQTQSFQPDTNSSFRGLFVNESGTFVSGYPSAIYKIENQTISSLFSIKHPKYSNYRFDFRGIQAFGRDTIIVFNSGSPAIVLKTVDAGKNWKEVYFQADSSFFLDGMAWKNEKEAWILADPIDGYFQLLHTMDAGNSWKLEKGPEAKTLEAAYAASNSTLIFDSGNLYLATGGSQSVIWVLKNKTWQKIETPAKTEEGCGIFSLAVQKNKIWIAGGCWQKPHDTEGNFYYSSNAGKSWQKASNPPQGYRSCLDCDQICVTTGSNGTEISQDHGKTWKKMDEGFHTCRIYKNKIWLAGSKGRVKIIAL